MTDDIVLPNDATRPQAPLIDNLTEAEKAPGRHLAMVHEHMRSSMTALRDLIEAARRGALSASELSEAAGNLPLLENYRRFGALCGQHCHVVHSHHSIEDGYIFPDLSSRAEAFRRVVARLIEEHDVVHALIIRLVGELGILVTAPTAPDFEAAVSTYDKLEKLLLSHFTYEERSIGPALGRFGIGA